MNASNTIIDATLNVEKRGELGDANLPYITDGGNPERLCVLRASQQDLTSLVVSPESSLNSVIQDVTKLDVCKNQISSLHGIEAFVALEVLDLSHNLLHVIDSHSASLLRSLVRLKTVDFSHNRIMLIDLNASAGGISKSTLTHGDIASNAFKITSLNLSHNSLIELPDLRSALNLQVLSLSYNNIEDLRDIDAKLPLLSLHTLRLSNNRLQNLTSLVPLTALASTLRHLELHGNFFIKAWMEKNERVDWVSKHTSRDAFGKMQWWRPFVLWLLPLTLTLDATAYTATEQQLTLKLFREQGNFSESLLKLMNPHCEKELVSYIWEQSKSLLTHERSRAAGQDSTHIVEEQANDGARSIKGQRSSLPAPTRAVEILPPESKRYVGDSAATGLNGSVPIGDVLSAIQNKLRSVSDVVHILWQKDIALRTRAAVIIQRHIRGALVRKRLPMEARQHFRAIRPQTAPARRPCLAHSGEALLTQTISNPHYYARSGTMPCSFNTSSLSNHSNPELIVQSSAPIGIQESYVSGIEEVLRTMRSLENVMTMMWADLDYFRAMARREQRSAATTIQRLYRGHIARKEWRKLKEGYEEFVVSITPYIHTLQRYGRGCLVRLRVAEQSQHRQEVTQLRKEIVEVRQETRELRRLLETFVSQQRLSRYEDPESAVEEIADPYAQGVHE